MIYLKYDKKREIEGLSSTTNLTVTGQNSGFGNKILITNKRKHTYNPQNYVVVVDIPKLYPVLLITLLKHGDKKTKAT